jgi:hypothetical protein
MAEDNQTTLKYDLEYAEVLRGAISSIHRLAQLSIDAAENHPGTLAEVIGSGGPEEDVMSLTTVIKPFRERLLMIEHMLGDRVALTKFYSIVTPQERWRFLIDMATAYTGKATHTTPDVKKSDLK